MRWVDVPDGSLLFDCYVPMNVRTLEALLASGAPATKWTKQGEPFVGVGRYVENLTPGEISMYLAHNVGVFTIGVARSDAMANPSGVLGTRDGAAAMARRIALGIPAGGQHVLDVEGPAKATGQQVAEYTNAANAAIMADLKTRAAFYEGWGIKLTAQQLHELLTSTLYYASSPFSLPPAERGFALVQAVENVSIAGTKIDVNRANADRLGGRFQMLVAG